MKRFRIACLLVLLFAALQLAAQPKLPDWNKAAGLDLAYDMTPKALSPAPKGYKATYIAHYGRHGSRYAYTAKSYSCSGSKNFTVKALRHKQGQLARMVNVSVSQQHKVYLSGRDGQIAVFVYIGSLLHSAVYQEPCTARFDKRTRACDLVSRT